MDIQPIIQYTGKVVPLFDDNIDADQIILKVHPKRITKTDFGSFAFDEWRHLSDGSDNPGFNLNKSKYKGASIPVTGDNFGCGSSREHAAWVSKDFGFDTIIAGGFSDIFCMNCTKNGTLPTVLNGQSKKYLANQNNMTIDLPNQTISANNQFFHFDIDETWKDKPINGLDDIAITLKYEELVEKYEEIM